MLFKQSEKMNIYLAYRSAYFPNSRFVKEFKEESILNWFQKNWEVFTKEDAEESDEYIKLLGTHIYGFPIWQVDDEPIPSLPKNFVELKSVIKKYTYSSEIIGDEECLKVLTDDDEIELAWFIFTESYKQKNIDDLSLWFSETFPLQAGIEGCKLAVDREFLPKGSKKGCTYIVSCPIYDGANLEDLEGAYKIENIRLPDFLNHILTNELTCKNEEEYTFTLREVEFIKHIAEKSGCKDLREVLEIFSKRPITELHEEDYKELTFDELLNLELRNDEEKSILNYSNHFCEICINSIGEFYNYWIIFDDLWVEKNKSLAKSILRFGKSWQL